MADKFLFLSYKRGAATTPAMERLYARAKVQLKGNGVETFFDSRSIEGGASWEPAIDAFLARTTHFLAFVSIDYWLSEQCMRELTDAVSRYERLSSPRLLFVLADRLDPNDLALDVAAAERYLQGDPRSEEPLRKVSSLGQINFLGPYGNAGRLVRLIFESPQALDDQFAALIESIKKLTGD